MTTNTDGAIPELPVVGALWNYIGTDPLRNHFKPCARALHEMNPDRPPYPETWQPIDKLVRLSDARAAIADVQQKLDDMTADYMRRHREVCELKYGTGAIQQAAGAVPENMACSACLSGTLHRCLLQGKNGVRAAKVCDNCKIELYGEEQSEYNRNSVELAASPAPPKQQPVHLGGGEVGRVPQWQPIETAPEGELVVVGWLDGEDAEHPERHMFDYLEDGVWQNYFNEHEHYLIAGAARGQSEDAPYTCWFPLASIPTGQINKPAGQGMDGGKG